MNSEDDGISLGKLNDSERGLCMLMLMSAQEGVGECRREKNCGRRAGIFSDPSLVYAA